MSRDREGVNRAEGESVIGPEGESVTGPEGEEVVESAGDDDRSESQERLARMHEWIFLTGDRRVIAGVPLALFLVVLTWIELSAGATSQQLVPLFYVSSAIIGGNFTLITIVISINQLVISRQLSAPGELREHIRTTTDYREASAELIGVEVPPPTPAAFLDVLLDGVQNQVRELESHRSDVASDDAVDAIDAVLDPLKDRISRSTRKLEAENASTFEALVVTLNTNYSDDIHNLSRLRTVHQDELSSDADDCLDTLITGLKRIDVARQYLRTVYIQEELSRVSRNLMYVGIPVVLVSLGLMEVFISTRQPVLSPGQLSVITPVFATVGAAPLTLLFAYVLRLSVVSERTAAITPFTTPTQEATPVEALTDDADE